MRLQFCILSLSMASATNLYVAGKNLITGLRLDLGSEASNLTTTTTHSGSAADPSWLFLDYPAGQLYCVDDGTTNNGSVSTYQTSPSGALTLFQRTPFQSAPSPAPCTTTTPTVLSYPPPQNPTANLRQHASHPAPTEAAPSSSSPTSAATSSASSNSTRDSITPPTAEPRICLPAAGRGMSRSGTMDWTGS